MCGGDLEINEKVSVGVCKYCGSTMTLPKLDDDRRANLYDRANHFRRNNEFDKAAAIYESILNEDKTDAEAYWSLVLCKYGIEYVEDPKTHKRIPTCNRAQFTSIFADEDYKQALANADSSARTIYEAEAKAIDKIQKGILEISAKEEPFDVFVCYKESDNNGRRTPDSVLAQDLYFQLKHEGFKVFFSRITLEDRLGAAYEPYIFAALNSSKVMVAIGTKPGNFTSPWVKNEWSRYLALIKTGAKKVLIPAYKELDPYDLPEEFSHLQAQDMSKLGFMQDLIRGIKKIISTEEHKSIAVAPMPSASVSNLDSLLKRAFMFLEDGDWKQADDYCEKVLDSNPENARAYIGKLMAELNIREESDLALNANPISDNNNFQKALRFLDEKHGEILKGYNQSILERIEYENRNAVYKKALSSKEYLYATEDEYKQAALAFKSISGFKDADAQAADCERLADDAHELAEQKRLEAERNAEIRRIAAGKRRANIKKIIKIVASIAVVSIILISLLNNIIIPSIKYNKAIDLIVDKQYSQAVAILRGINDYKDSKEQIVKTQLQILKQSDVGNLVEFGNYEQDNNFENGKEPIQWRVLLTESTQVLLISEKCIDCQPYNIDDEGVTWETCSLRSWLNNDFSNEAFTTDEKEKIVLSRIINDNNAEFGIDGGNVTDDNIFLLSNAEVENYFPNDANKQALVTVYAEVKGVSVNDGIGVWWLRSPGICQNAASYVDSDGGDNRCCDVDADCNGIRPALWVNLSS